MPSIDSQKCGIDYYMEFQNEWNLADNSLLNVKWIRIGSGDRDEDYVRQDSKYFMTYGVASLGGGYDYFKGIAKDQSQGLFYVQEFIGNGSKYSEKPAVVQGSNGKNVYAPMQDVYTKEVNDENCQGQPISKESSNFLDTHFTVARLNRNDVIIMPFTSDTDVFYDAEERVLYRETPAGRTDKIIGFAQEISIENINASLGFLDTTSVDEILRPFSGKIILRSSSAVADNQQTLSSPSAFNSKAAKRISDFDPKTDTLNIDINSFGLDGAASFASAKNRKQVKSKYSRQNADFIYDSKSGALYFNENGTAKGFGDGGMCAVFAGAPSLDANNVAFI